MYASLGVTPATCTFDRMCRGLLRATAVTRGVERTPNKSRHTKLTSEKKILPPLLPGFELATFRLRGRLSNQLSYPGRSRRVWYEMTLRLTRLIHFKNENPGWMVMGGLLRRTQISLTDVGCLMRWTRKRRRRETKLARHDQVHAWSWSFHCTANPFPGYSILNSEILPTPFLARNLKTLTFFKLQRYKHLYDRK